MRSLINRLFRRQKSTEFRYLLPTPLFMRALEQERMRTDRAGGAFALIELRFEPPGRFPNHVRPLERLLQNRLRCTDTCGFLSDRLVGVLLPHTSVWGARTVIHDLNELWGSNGAKIVANVKVYTSSSDEDSESRPASHDGERRRTDDRRQPGQLEPVPAGAEALLFVKPLPVWKRSLDLLGAVIGLSLLAPLLAAVASGILVTSGRPVLFKQRRSGLGGKPFWIYKFRTMSRDAEDRKAELRRFSEQDGPAFKMKADPRITRLGHLLRKSCLDELPQLWNVLRGEMTLVGPRPLPCEESDECSGWQRRRLEVTPGLTCIWQVDGKSRVPFVEWMRMDLRYVRSRTLWLDLKLIARTAVAVVLHRASH